MYQAASNRHVGGQAIGAPNSQPCVCAAATPPPVKYKRPHRGQTKLPLDRHHLPTRNNTRFTKMKKRYSREDGSHGSSKFAALQRIKILMQELGQQKKVRRAVHSWVGALVLREDQNGRLEPSPYAPLDEDQKEIRLLTVHAGRFKQPIVCSIEHASLKGDALTQYETISYCWGDQSDRAFIHLNGTKISVPASSAAALRRMRLSDRNRVLWIDAVSINQADYDERGKQVSMMGEIFTNSTGNLVYLGEGDSMTAAALQSIQSVVDEINQDTDEMRSIQETCFDPNSDWVNQENAPQRTVDYDALESFYSIKWFR